MHWVPKKTIVYRSTATRLLKKKTITGNIVNVIRKQDYTDRLLFLIRFGSKF